MKKIILPVIWAFSAAWLQAGPVDINFVFVNDPGVNCVFNPTCTVTVDDSTAPIHFPGWPSTAPFFLQSRTFDGVSGAPAAGLYGYEYRVDLTVPPDLTGPMDECLFSVTIDFGPIVPMDFDGSGTKNPVYVISEGGIGSLAPEVVVQDGSQVTFVFAAEADTGLISQLCLGGGSFFIGLVSTQPPVADNAILDTNGGAQMGIGPQVVGDRVPRKDPFILILRDFELVGQFPLGDWTGSNRLVQVAHRDLTFDILSDATDLLRLGEADSAGDLLRFLLGKVTGSAGNWLQDNPAAGQDAETLFYENLATLINLLQPGSPVPMTPPQAGQPGSAPGT